MDGRPLHGSSPVRESLGKFLRPGGSTLTERAVAITNPSPQWLMADIGCGAGGSLDYLFNNGFHRVVGLDPAPALHQEGEAISPPMLKACAEALPMKDSSMDMLFCECVWTLTDKRRTLDEFRRVLRPGGILALSDIVVRGELSEDWPVACCFAGAITHDEAVQCIHESGMQVLRTEDHTALLRRTAAEFVFRHGSLRGFWEAITGNRNSAQAACDAAASSRPGLMLFIAEKPS